MHISRRRVPVERILAVVKKVFHVSHMRVTTW
jgi:hypothetical protein